MLMSKTMSSEDWEMLRDEAERAMGTLLWRYINERFERRAAVYHRDLLDVSKPESDLRFAQGYLAAMRYATMILEEIIKEAASGRQSASARESANV